MNGERDLRFLQLWDCYSGLLTPTQRQITDLYFNYDLSLSEIAAEKGITRQGVQECLKKCRQQLEEYENALHFSEHMKKTSQKAAGAARWAESFIDAHPEFNEEVAELLKILDKENR